MIIGIPKEFVSGETRVSTVPETVAKYKKIGHSVVIEAGAGLAAGFSDEAYRAQGAEVLAAAKEVYARADVLLKVQRPEQHPSGQHELEMLRKGSLLVGFFYPLVNKELVQKAAACGVDVIAIDAVPRITKAQRMDALSSQTNLAGYKAVLIAANTVGKIFPLMMTAAGTIAPARVIIMGAGVAGLQAIATARRLGAVVEVSDVRPEVKEQVESLGGRFIEVESDEDLSGEGGYAKQASEEFLRKQQAVLEERLAEADAVITTALVPGRKAPVLITEAMLKKMKPGSVVVDMAVEQGGNCESSRPGQTVVAHGVTVVGPVNLPALLPYNASELYARNLLSLVDYLTKDATIQLNPEDEIVQGALIVRGGVVVHAKTKEAIGG